MVKGEQPNERYGDGSNHQNSPSEATITHDSGRSYNVCFCYSFLIAIMYPIYFIVIASFSDPSSVANGQVWVFPKGFTLEGYEELLRHENIWIGYRNTILYTVVGTLIGLVVNISAAYALSRKDLVGRKFFSVFFIFTMF